MVSIVQTTRGRVAAGYAVAIAAVLVAAAVRFGLDHWLNGRGTYLFFTVATLFVAVFVGRGPATLACLLAIAVVRASGWHSGHLWSIELLAFLPTVAFVIWIAGRVTTLRHEAQESQIQAERRAERADELAEELNLLLDGASGYGIYMLDPEGNVTIWNKAAERLKGWTEEEVLGRHYSLFYPEGAIAAGKPQHDLIRTRTLGRLEEEDWRVRKNGSEFLAHVTMTALYNRDGQLKGFGKVIRDVTMQRAAEQRIEELRQDLIHTARVSAMGTMASTLAHELNQPITAVATFVSGVRNLLRGEAPQDPDMIEEGLAGAYDEALRAGRIVRRLREFVARGEVDKRVSDVEELVENASKLALIGASERGVEARFRFDPTAPLVLVDSIQIQQVLINLMRNAIEAMSHSPQRVLTVSSAPEDGSLVRITVADTGPGVAPEIARNLFSAFNSTKVSGLGLGLSICRTIVEANDGKIWMEPDPAGGTRFHFTVLRADVEVQEWEVPQ